MNEPTEDRLAGLMCSAQRFHKKKARSFWEEYARSDDAEEVSMDPMLFMVVREPPAPAGGDGIGAAGPEPGEKTQGEEEGGPTENIYSAPAPEGGPGKTRAEAFRKLGAALTEVVEGRLLVVTLVAEAWHARLSPQKADRCKRGEERWPQVSKMDNRREIVIVNSLTRDGQSVASCAEVRRSLAGEATLAREWKDTWKDSSDETPQSRLLENVFAGANLRS